MRKRKYSQNSKKNGQMEKMFSRAPATNHHEWALAPLRENTKRRTKRLYLPFFQWLLIISTIYWSLYCFIFINHVVCTLQTSKNYKFKSDTCSNSGLLKLTPFVENPVNLMLCLGKHKDQIQEWKSFLFHHLFIFLWSVNWLKIDWNTCSMSVY